MLAIAKGESTRWRLKAWNEGAHPRRRDADRFEGELLRFGRRRNAKEQAGRNLRLQKRSSRAAHMRAGFDVVSKVPACCSVPREAVQATRPGSFTSRLDLKHAFFKTPVQIGRK